MSLQTIALAFVASLYPLGLLAITFLLRSERPLGLGLMFYAGAFLATFVMGALVIFVLRSFHLEAPSHGSSRDGLRLGVGIALVLLGIMVARRPRSKPEEAGSEAGWKRKLQNPRPWSVFLVGILLYLPSATYVAAAQQVATTEASGIETFVSLVVVVVIVLLFVELPLISYAVAPAKTSAAIGGVVDLVERNEQTVYSLVLIVLGILVAIPALVGLL